MKGIRLTDFAVKTICAIFRGIFPEEDHWWIFSSRVDLSKMLSD